VKRTRDSDYNEAIDSILETQHLQRASSLEIGRLRPRNRGLQEAIRLILKAQGFYNRAGAWHDKGDDDRRIAD